jgi:hypothetical protein
LYLSFVLCSLMGNKTQSRRHKERSTKYKAQSSSTTRQLGN